ncbi:ribose 5-phosphate isomerase B [Leptospira bandrabouensis]|uniref:Ribose 5-phosphate isomerase B n=1 Tax=Leptospira bandrabouensis TaxID=2484903 RepID=A0A6H3P1D6_9LEPT|nr:ribose 5-phosphate isomerase B [Leptospira bandrabouensis]MCG6145733.1 ribose 5-phosphate isomerase B [Leptospira bandrabouensis]MCG6153242.1 ribose 5-phosphate isomerase B [Leptospira bandrabouensis]MCG6160724.1 ribose 5-phosphate isomerase B [Leptospira bandrabouensis]MCG6165265.1 ribose 5-phosphate isomerase B [Leptospira bandrabouensis]MCW7458648.1 ribose 5-phosphate isomerase B [Leptospira bandrabouensis]
MKEKIGIASDHGGFALKEFLRKSLEETYEIVDYGTKSEESVDYPTIIGDACRKVLSGEVPKLIALCGTGIGASIVANRFKGIRAALCHDEFTAEMSKRHNNANVLVLGGRVLGTDLAQRIVKKWIETEFEGGRHQKRLGQIEEQS